MEPEIEAVVSYNLVRACKGLQEQSPSFGYPHGERAEGAVGEYANVEVALGYSCLLASSLHGAFEVAD